MSGASDLEGEIKHLIVDTLQLEDVTPADISSDMALFGDGLGLDSVDALELGLALFKKFGVRIDGDASVNRAHFANVQALAAFVSARRA